MKLMDSVLMEREIVAMATHFGVDFLDAHDPTEPYQSTLL